jgi:hypothetical protein
VTDKVRLAPVDEDNLEPLLAVAAAEATPDEVMPPVEAPAGWSHARREAFRAFHRRHFGGLAGPTRTVMYAILVDAQVVGMIRLAWRDGSSGRDGSSERDGSAERSGARTMEMETGMWLGQSARGQGFGVLRRCGGRLQPDGRGGVRVELPVTPHGLH